MKYWFFDGNDVVGPFSLKELIEQKSFGEMSLVCPENYSDDGNHWQPAASFDDFKPFFTSKDPEEDTSSFEQEMDTLLKQSSPLAFDETPSEGPGLQIPKKPAKPGPIEDYFNQVKAEDLGDILGIPNPNENSDMDLAHALEKQLAKTSSTRRKEREQESEVDKQTAAELEKANETHHVATATEVFSTQNTTVATTPAAAPAPTPLPQKGEPSMPVVESPTMPVVALPATATSVQTGPEPTSAKSETEAASPSQESANADSTTPADTTASPAPAIVPDPAQLRREKVKVNSIRAHLKQTQEMKDFLDEAHNRRVRQKDNKTHRFLAMLLTAIAIIGGLFLAFELRTQASITAHLPTPTVPVINQELLTEPTPSVAKTSTTPAPVQVPRPAVNAQTASQEQKALEIVKNHLLSGQRGTLANYLSRIYHSQLSQGYTGTWAAEPLYKNIYIVKYQLTKTRKEPIIYVFQADVAQGKLTSALNNISLDLVGKL